MNATIKRATFEITDEEAIDLFHALKRDLEYTIDTHWNRHLATLRRERDELRAELLTTHQMACRVGLERDELLKDKERLDWCESIARAHPELENDGLTPMTRKSLDSARAKQGEGQV